MENYRKQTLKRVVFSKPYIYYFIAIFAGYFVLNGWVNQLQVTGLTIFTTYRLSYAIPFSVFLLIIPALVALNFNLVVCKFQDIKRMGKRGSLGVGGLGGFGVFAGLVGGACPGCLVGLFPAVVGIFGIVGTSLSVLPYNGLEIQAFSVLLLLIGGFYLTKPVVCEI